MYWTDENKDVVERSTVHGHNRKIVWKSDGVNLVGITLAGNHLYVTDWQNR